MWLVFASLLSAPAWAGSCCGGSTPLLPARVDRTESALIGTTVDASFGLARWDATGHAQPLSVQEQALTVTALAGWRWDPKGQLSLTMPLVINHRATEVMDTWAARPGDLRVTALWEPVLEGRRTGRPSGAPVPGFTFGVRAPTGSPWWASRDPLGADITGGRDVGLSTSFVVQRTTDDIPWSLSAGVELGVGKQTLTPTLHAGAGVGGLIGERWTLSGTLLFEDTWNRGPSGWTSAWHTSAQLQATYSVFRAWRVWGAISADLPAPGLGREHMVEGHAVMGVAWVR